MKGEPDAASISRPTDTLAGVDFLNVPRCSNVQWPAWGAAGTGNEDGSLKDGERESSVGLGDEDSEL